MEAQMNTYVKLDSLDTYPEIYKTGDDLKVLIEPQTPLNEKTPYSYPATSIKKIKKKKRVLNTLDSLISIFIVTPCVVGCWRGIWQIMDIYSYYFPPWESFFIGTVTHIVLALGQDVFHHVVVEKDSNNPFLRTFTLFLMKFYIVTFNVITNLIWRGGWIIFDKYCGVQLSESGSVLKEGSSTAIWFTIVCGLLLFCLKGLKNTMSPPFSIALDSKDEVFLFSTRYIFRAITATILFITKPQGPKENDSEAEKLVSSQSMQMEYFQRQPPRPFGINTLGPPPQEFTPSAPTLTSMTYPQLATYRNNYQPKNIQEILGYINKYRSYDGDMQESSTKDNAIQITKTNSSSSFANDPFYPYKPTDPSEINLLATASFRFAPPVWKNFRKLYQKTSKQQENIPRQQVDTSNIQESIKSFAKPFVVTLNVFPMEDQHQTAYTSRYGQRISSQRIQGGVPYKLQGDSRARYFGDRGNKLMIKLNVFPESMFPFAAQDEEPEESGVTKSKVKFV